MEEELEILKIEYLSNWSDLPNLLFYMIYKFRGKLLENSKEISSVAQLSLFHIIDCFTHGVSHDRQNNP